MAEDSDFYVSGGDVSSDRTMDFDQNPTNHVGIPDISAFSAVKPVDLAQLYRDSICPGTDNADAALEAMDNLEKMAVAFLDNFKIPVNGQVPMVVVRNGKFAMRGLLFSAQMVEAFRKLGSEVELVEPDIERRFLYEVKVDLGFFEKIVLGETGAVSKGILSSVSTTLAQA